MQHRTIKTATHDIARHEFDSMSDFVDAALNHRPAWSTISSRSTYRPAWFGTATIEDACRLALSGWEIGRAKASKIRDNLTARTTIALAPDATMDVAGAYPIAALAAAGDPCAMVNPAPIETKARPIVRIAASVSASQVYTADEVTNYGACLAAVIDALESAAFSVELTAVNACVAMGGRRQAYVATVMVKKAGDHAEIDRISFALTHPAMLRRLMFAAHETVAEHEGAFSGNYGRPWADNAMPWLEPGQIFIPGVNILPPGSPALKSPETAYPVVIARVRKLLTDAGINMPPIYGDESASRGADYVAA